MVLLNSGFTSLLCIGLIFQLYFGLIFEFFSGFIVLLKVGLRLISTFGSCLFSEALRKSTDWNSKQTSERQE